MSDKNSNRYAIIVAGGSGKRFGSELPKQFLPIDDKPVLMRTIEKFAQAGVNAIVVVLPQEHHELWLKMCHDVKFPVSHTIATGGATRFESVKNGIAAIDNLTDNDVVAVHDGVRPLVSVELIERCYATATEKGSAIPVVSPIDSIRQVAEDGTSRQLLRSSLRAVQTPQTFTAQWLRGAYEVEESPLFTDDASVVESTGHQITLIDGESTNIKITHPIDLVVATQLINDGKAC